ncbi:MAG: type II toxin-antitoxin system PemK/MazF family toxin [Campylobacterales bacterium]
MTDFSKYDVVVVKFPFASSLKYKARPAVVVSSDLYNQNKRDTLLILAISSSKQNRLDIEKDVLDWEDAGLLEPSIFKAAIATIEKDFVINSIGRLSSADRQTLDNMINTIC